MTLQMNKYKGIKYAIKKTKSNQNQSSSDVYKYFQGLKEIDPHQFEYNEDPIFAKREGELESPPSPSGKSH